MNGQMQSFRQNEGSTCAKSSETGTTTETGHGRMSFHEYHVKIDDQKIEALDIDEFDAVVDDLHSAMSFTEETKMSIRDGKFAEANKVIINTFEVRSHENALCGKTMSVKSDNGKEIDFAYIACRLEYKVSKPKGLIQRCITGVRRRLGAQDQTAQDDSITLSVDEEEEILTHVRKKCNEIWTAKYPHMAQDF